MASSFQNFFSAYLGKLDGLINDLKKCCGTDNEIKREKGLEDESQWSKLQNSFKMIEMCGELLFCVLQSTLFCPILFSGVLSYCIILYLIVL